MRRTLAMLVLLCGCHSAKTAPSSIELVTTTTTQDSGLLERLVPAAEKATGVRIKVLAFGSGEALAHATTGDADLVITHSPAAEEEVVKAGDLVDRAPLMWNRFLLVGPSSDPAKVRGAGGDPAEAFRRIRASKAPFVSRGDESGTHKKEEALWKLAGVPVDDPQIKRTGQGQGETVMIADQTDAYALVDTSTWSKLHASHLAVLLDPNDAPAKGAVMINPYHVMLENPAKHPDAHVDAARKVKAWLATPEAAAIISSGGLFTVGAPSGSA